RGYESGCREDGQGVAEVLVLDQGEEDEGREGGEPEQGARGAMFPERPQSPQEQRAPEEPELGGEGPRIVGQRRAGQRLGVLLLRRLLEGAAEDLHGQAEESRAVPGQREERADGEGDRRPAEATAAIG